MSEVTIYHNPRCSKSRQTLEIIEGKGITPEVVLYLETPPSEAELSDILAKLELPARSLMRIKESEYKDNHFDNEDLNDQDLIKAMIKFPKLIERPIVLSKEQAVIGRPPENVLEII